VRHSDIGGERFRKRERLSGALAPLSCFVAAVVRAD
jgi:hypothetical protein